MRAWLPTLGVCLALFAAAPAQAQERSQSPFANPEDPTAIRMMSAFEALEKALDALEPQAEAIRADVTVSEAVRRERLMKLLSQEEDRLLEVEARTASQDDEMVHAAHASFWHWSRSEVDDLPQRLAVGE